MELTYWWLSSAVLVGLSIVFIIKRRRKLVSHVKRLPVAHSDRLRHLPAYQLELRRLRRWLRVGLVVAAVALFTGLLLVGRFSTVTVTEPETKNRDIMLCLDVSGSMTEDDKVIIGTFAELAKGFDGERLGLSLFDNSSALIFPLTNDYQFIADKLTDIKKQIESNDYSGDIYNGTVSGQGSSIIGDGLASCVSRFDRLDSKRSRSVILATDNYLAGSPIVTLKQAAAYAKSKSVRVYGINPYDYSSGGYTDPVSQEFHDQVLLTGGDYYKLSDPQAVPSIITKITAQEATRFKGSPQIMTTDQPVVLLPIFLLAAILIMFAAWRIKS